MFSLARLASPLLHLMRYPRTYSAAADQLFKDYYSRRLSLPAQELQHYLNRLAQLPFSTQDHRWMSLTHALETHLHQYTPKSQTYMLKLVITLDSRAPLVAALMQSLLQNLNQLDFEETAVLLWCIGKLGQQQQQLQPLAQIYQRLNQLLANAHAITIKLRDAETEQETTGEVASISPTSLSMVLSSMASLAIIDAPLLKTLSLHAVKPNLPLFSCTALCTFLTAFERLGLRNKRVTFQVYKQIRSMPNQVEQVSIQTLLNLAFCVANLSQRDPSLQDRARLEKHPDQLEKKETELADMRNFFGWICETVFLREPGLHHSKAALILLSSLKIHHFHPPTWLAACTRITQNIMDAKVIDLVMALKAIASLTPNKREPLQKEQEIITQRLWQLESSIAGKSLHTLAFLYKNKLIKPPPTLTKTLTRHLIDLEGKGKFAPFNQRGQNNGAQKREETNSQAKQQGTKSSVFRSKSNQSDRNHNDRPPRKSTNHADAPTHPNKPPNNYKPKPVNPQRPQDPPFKQ